MSELEVCSKSQGPTTGGRTVKGSPHSPSPRSVSRRVGLMLAQNSWVLPTALPQWTLCTNGPSAHLKAQPQSVGPTHSGSTILSRPFLRSMHRVHGPPPSSCSCNAPPSPAMLSCRDPSRLQGSAVSCLLPEAFPAAPTPPLLSNPCHGRVSPVGLSPHQLGLNPG